MEAQTIANVYIALENNLEIIPVLNKIDLPAANAGRVKSEIEQTIGLDCTQALEVSAKANIGISELLNKIVELIPPPSGDINAPTKALIYDSWFDNYLGALALVRFLMVQSKLGRILYYGKWQESRSFRAILPSPTQARKNKRNSMW